MDVAYRDSTINIWSDSLSREVTTPAGVVSGDLLIMYAAVFDTGPVISTPSGWTLLDSTNTSPTQPVYIFYKIATGSEPASYTLTRDGNSNWVWGAILVAVSGGPFTSANIEGHTLRVNQSTTTATGNAVTPTSSPGSLLLFFVTNVSSGGISTYAVATNNPTWTERQDSAINGGGSGSICMSLATAVRDLITSTGAATAVTSVSAHNAVSLITIRPNGYEFAPGFSLAAAVPTPQESAATTVAPPVLAVAASMPTPVAAQGSNPVTNVQKHDATGVVNVPKS
jgi:hypothetical protein